jgi:branched-chain amino acid aminotransferase
MDEPHRVGFEAQGIVFFRGRFMPVQEATVSIATHALNYGTGCFEGIRGYWNEGHGELYLLRLLDHYRRLQRSARFLRISLPLSPKEMAAMTVELVRSNGYRRDVYVRPLAFKSNPAIRVGLIGLDDAFGCFTAPMGDYHSVGEGLSVTVSSWRRNGDSAIPPRVKTTGGYMNAAIAVADAQAGGYDEAILLTADGFVSEASAANLFAVRDGQLVTPDVSSDILPGITRSGLLDIAHRAGIPAVERRVARTELHLADELFLCGTGVQIAPITSLDGRPVGDGEIGPVTRELQRRYFAAVRGEDDVLLPWLTPVYGAGLSLEQQLAALGPGA